MTIPTHDGHGRPYTQEELDAYRRLDEELQDPAALAAFIAAVERGRAEIRAGLGTDWDDFEKELNAILNDED